MAPLNVLSNPAHLQHKYRLAATDGLRRRALERLYQRRCAVDDLIESLERYQCSQAARRADCVEITAGKK